MQRLYSPSTGTTYLVGFHPTIPQDAVEISEEVFLSVIANPLPGKVRSHDLNGQPILIDLPAQSIVDQLNGIYTRQLRLINTACEVAITSGVWSSTLGQPHQYSSLRDDQLNLTGAILAGLDTLYPCRDEEGLKEFRLHTSAQLRQVGDDFLQFKLQQLQKSNDLKQRLDQALTDLDLAALEAVSWEGEL